MRGIARWNFPAFDEAARLCDALGIEHLSPADLDRSLGITEDAADEAGSYPPEAFHAAMRRDIPAVLSCGGVLLLRGWETSTGANVEKTVNDAVGGRLYKVVYADEIGGHWDDMIGIEEQV